jgi:tetratricopeptide (TPR) repeat protein
MKLRKTAAALALAVHVSGVTGFAPAPTAASTIGIEVSPSPRSLVPESLLVTPGTALDVLEAQLRARLDTLSAPTEDPAAAQDWFSLGTVLFHRDARDDALQAWTTAHRLDPVFAPPEVMADLQTAVMLENRGETEAAALLRAEATARHAENAHMQLALAERAMRSARLEEAGTAYRRAAELAPDLFTTSLNLARYMEFIERPEAARTHYIAATEAAPGRAAPWDFLGAHQFRWGETEAALASLRRAEAASPVQPLAEVRLAELSAGAGDWIGARHWYLRALARAEDGQAAIRVALGNAQLRLGLLHEAAATLDAVLAEEEIVPVLVARGQLDEGLGQLEDAVDRYRRAIRLDPGNLVAANNLAMALVRLDRNADEALTHARYAHQTLPGNAEIFGTYALSLAMAGDAAAALPALERAVRLLPTDLWLRHRLGILLATGGSPAEARIHLEACSLIVDADFPHAADCAARLAALPAP